MPDAWLCWLARMRHTGRARQADKKTGILLDDPTGCRLVPELSLFPGGNTTNHPHPRPCSPLQPAARADHHDGGMSTGRPVDPGGIPATGWTIWEERRGGRVDEWCRASSRVFPCLAGWHTTYEALRRMLFPLEEEGHRQNTVVAVKDDEQHLLPAVPPVSAVRETSRVGSCICCSPLKCAHRPVAPFHVLPHLLSF